LQSLSEEEQKLFRLYGKLPNRKDIVGNKLKVRLPLLLLFPLRLTFPRTAGAQVL